MKNGNADLMLSNRLNGFSVLIRARVFKLLSLLIAITLLSSGCSKQDDDLNIKKVSGLEEDIPYDAIGGGKLVFTRGITTYIIDSDSKTSWGLRSEYGSGVISPNGENIAYTIFTHDSHLGVYVADIYGKNIRNISKSSNDCYNPCWTPDSKNILYEEYTPLVIVQKQSLDDNVKSKVKAFRDLERIYSRISASSLDQLAFSFSTYGAYGDPAYGGIFTMGLDGANLTQLTSDSFPFGQSPAWSPDGNTIAYIQSERNGNYYQSNEIVLMDRNGANVRSLTKFLVSGSFYIDATFRDPSIV